MDSSEGQKPEARLAGLKSRSAGLFLPGGSRGGFASSVFQHLEVTAFLGSWSPSLPGKARDVRPRPSPAVLSLVLRSRLSVTLKDAP